MSIEVKNLFKYYGQQAAVNDVSFSVKQGEILGFLGPNGAGKSTSMKIITGFIPSHSGEVTVCGLKVDVDNLEARKLIGYLPENNPLYLDMYVKEYLEFVGGIYKINKLKSRVNEMIDAVGLGIEQNKKIGALSKGYRQRVGLAQAIIHDPKVLILDEPTSGLDPNQLVEIRELIRTIGQQKTVMFSTHIMQEAEAICDRLVIINNGRIVANDRALSLQEKNEEQTSYIEFDQVVSKTQLAKIVGVKKVEAVKNGWLVSADQKIDLNKEIALHAQQEGWLILTLKTEKKTLEEVFRNLTK
jgi:ABC-2 type transport system ATP-binding protein